MLRHLWGVEALLNIQHGAVVTVIEWVVFLALNGSLKYTPPQKSGQDFAPSQVKNVTKLRVFDKSHAEILVPRENWWYGTCTTKTCGTKQYFSLVLKDPYVLNISKETVSSLYLQLLAP
jgi:hypothetical protein